MLEIWTEFVMSVLHLFLSRSSLREHSFYYPHQGGCVLITVFLVFVREQDDQKRFAANFSARCVRQNESSRYCHDVRPSVCPSGTGVHCEFVIIRCTLAQISLLLLSTMFWAPSHQSMSTYSQPPFSSSTWKRGGVWMCKLGEELDAYRPNDKYVLHR